MRWTGGEGVYDYADRAPLPAHDAATDGSRSAVGWHAAGPGADVGPRFGYDEAASAWSSRLPPVVPGVRRRPDRGRVGRADRRRGPAPAVLRHAPGGATHYGLGFTGNGVGPCHLGGRILSRRSRSVARGRGDDAPDRRRRPQRFPPEPIRSPGTRREPRDRPAGRSPGRGPGPNPLVDFVARAAPAPRLQPGTVADGPAARASVSAVAGWRHGRRGIIAERLTKSYGTTAASIDLTFSVGAGEVFGYLGPNGAGKTTDDPHDARLHPADRGPGAVFGLDAAPRTRRDPPRASATCPGELALYERMTGARLPPRLRRASAAASTGPIAAELAERLRPRPGRTDPRAVARQQAEGRPRPGVHAPARPAGARRADAGAGPARAAGRSTGCSTRRASEGRRSSSRPT